MFETMVEQERRLQSKREQDQKQVVQLQQKLAGIQGKWEALQSQLHDDEMPTVSQRTIQDAVLQDIPDQFQNDLNEWQVRNGMSILSTKRISQDLVGKCA